MHDKSVHLALGSCRYAEYKPGDLVEISRHGWKAGLSVNYAFTVGTVVKFEKGILTVTRYQTTESKEFHPCFWDPCTPERCKELVEKEKLMYWFDHVPTKGDDLQLD